MKQRRIVGKPWDNTSKKTVNTVTNQPMTWEQWQRIQIDQKMAADNEAAKVKANNPFWTVIVKKSA
jgi:hypothetical protein